MALKLYTLANCDRCRAAVKWLHAQQVDFQEFAIRDTPPPVAELQRMRGAVGDLRRLFNTSGRDYRDQQLGPRLPTMADATAYALLHGNGNLVKRPFLIGGTVALVGFDEPTWSEALPQMRSDARKL